MRASLAKAISMGVVQALGTHRVMLGGAAVDAEVYREGENIHVEIDCNQQSMSTRLGQVAVNGAIHLQMDVATFQRISVAANSYGAKLLQAAEWLTNRPPMLRSGNGD